MDKTKALKRAVKLLRLSRGTSNAGERSSAEAELARLKKRCGLSDADVDSALEDASGPHSVDAGPLGPESPATAALLGNVFGDDIVRDGNRASGKAARRPRAEEAARRYAYMAGQMRACAERRSVSSKDAELFYAVVALTVEDRLRDLRESQTRRRAKAGRARGVRGGVSPPRESSQPAPLAAPPRREHAQPAAPVLRQTPRPPATRLTRLGDLRTPPGKMPKMIRLGDAMRAAAEAVKASASSGNLPQHVVTAAVEEGELRVDILPLVLGVDWATCPKPAGGGGRVS